MVVLNIPIPEFDDHGQIVKYKLTNDGKSDARL
jgi:hypothetical protein